MSSQSAKDEILGRIKTGKPPEIPLPDVPMYRWEGNPLENFLKKLIACDGKAVKFRTRQDAIEWLKQQPEMVSAVNAVYSSAEGVEGNFSESNLTDLRNAHKIQIYVTEGVMGVGEMGAIWVTNKTLKHAVCALLAKRLFVLLDKNKIEGGLHEAYAKLNLREQQYGAFFTGPSATADIEAVRITGAQGPLGLTALIYNCEDASAQPQLLVNPNTDTSPWLKVAEEPD